MYTQFKRKNAYLFNNNTCVTNSKFFILINKLNKIWYSILKTVNFAADYFQQKVDVIIIKNRLYTVLENVIINLKRKIQIMRGIIQLYKKGNGSSVKNVKKNFIEKIIGKRIIQLNMLSQIFTGKIKNFVQKTVHLDLMRERNEKQILKNSKYINKLLKKNTQIMLNRGLKRLKLIILKNINKFKKRGENTQKKIEKKLNKIQIKGINKREKKSLIIIKIGVPFVDIMMFWIYTMLKKMEKKIIGIIKSQHILYYAPIAIPNIIEDY